MTDTRLLVPEHRRLSTGVIGEVSAGEQLLTADVGAVNAQTAPIRRAGNVSFVSVRAIL
jgi:hypothetical protein